MATATELKAVISADVSGFEKAIGKVEKDVGGLSKSVEGSTGDAARGFDKMGGAAKLAGGVGKAAMLGVAGAVAGVAAGAVLGAKAWFDYASDADQAQRELQASLGMTADEAAALADVGKDVFANNWGGSIGEATAAVGELRKAFYMLEGDELQHVTEQAFALRDAFGIELEGSIAAAQRMAGAFGMTAAEAMDTLALGMQTTSMPSEELAILMQEYSGHLAELGVSAVDAFGMMQSGMEAGVMEGDKVLDALKEMNLTLSEGSESQREMFADLGLGNLIDDFQTGKVTGLEAFQEIQMAMMEMGENVPTDIIEGIFGGVGGDIGQNALVNIYSMADGFEVVEGAAMDAGNAVNDNIGSAFETMKRTALTALGSLGSGAFEPLKSGIIDAMGTVTEKIALFGELMSTAGDWSSSFGETWATTMSEVTGLDFSGIEGPINAVVGAFDQFWQMMEIGEGVVDSLQSALGMLAFNLGADAETVHEFHAAFDTLQGIIATAGEWIRDTLVPALQSIASWMIENKDIVLTVVAAFAAFEIIMVVVGWVGALVSAVGGLMTAFTAGGGAITAIVAILGGPLTIAIGAVVATVALLVTAWRKDWGGIQEKTAAVVDALKAAWESLTAGIQAVVDFVAAVPAKWQALKDGIVGAQSEATDSVKTSWADMQAGVGDALAAVGDGITAAWDSYWAFIERGQQAIHDAIMSVWNQIPADIREDLVEIATELKRRWDEYLATVERAMELILAIIEDQWGELVALVTGALETVSEVVSATWGAVRDTVQGTLDAITSFVGEKWAEVVAAVSAAMDTVTAYIALKWAEARAAVIEATAPLVEFVTGVWEKIKDATGRVLDSIVSFVGQKAQELKAKFLDPIAELVGDMQSAGADIVAGLKQGILDNWQALKDWFWDQVRALVQSARDALLARSPSQAFVNLGEDVVEGFRIGLIGLEAIVRAVNETLGKMINQQDVESFEQVARALAAITDIVTSAMEAIAAITSSVAVSGVENITETFQKLQAVIKEIAAVAVDISAGADKDVSPNGFFNKWDIPNVTRTSEALGNFTDALSGMLDVADRLAQTGAPASGAMSALADGMRELAKLAKAIGDEFGGDAGIAAAGGISGSLKAMADVLGTVASLNLAGIVALTADQMQMVKDNAKAMVDAIAEVAVHFTTMAKDDAEGLAALVTGVEAYAATIGAARDMLESAAVSELAGAVRISDRYMGVIKANAEKLRKAIEEVAAEYIAMAKSEDGGLPELLEGTKAYAEVVSAIVSVVNDMADAELTEGMKVSSVWFGMSLQLLTILREQMATYVAEWAEAVEDFDASVDAWDYFASIVSAIVDVANTVESAAMTTGLTIDSRFFKEALDRLHTLRKEMREYVAEWAEGVEDFEKASEPWAYFSEIVSAIVGVANAVQSAALTEAMDVHAGHFREALMQLNTMRDDMETYVEEWTDGVQDFKTAAEPWQLFATIVGTITSVVGAVAGLTTSGGGGGDISSVIGRVVDNIKMMFEALRGLITGPDALTVEEAEALGKLMTAAGAMAGGLQGILEVVANAVANPFGQIKAVDGGKGTRGNTLRENLKRQIVSALEFATEAVQEAAKSLEEIKLGEGVLDSIAGVVSAFDGILGLVERVDAMGGVNLRGIYDLVKVPKILADGLTLAGNIGADADGEASLAGGTLSINLMPTFLPINNEFAVTTVVQVGPVEMGRWHEAYQQFTNRELQTQ